MKIIGHGMIATSLAPYRDQHADALIFASGVATSITGDPAIYEREYRLLYETLHACQQSGQRIVYFSSGGAIYGATNALRSETTPTFPTSQYGRHKLLCEAIIRSAGVPYLILRLANLVGVTRNRTQLIPALIEQVKSGRVTLFARATRDLLDVEDFARILVCLLDCDPPSDLITVASGQSIPVLAIAEEICRLLGLEVAFDLVDQGDEQRFDIAKLRRILPQDERFGADYYRSVLAKYAAAYLREDRP